MESKSVPLFVVFSKFSIGFQFAGVDHAINEAYFLRKPADEYAYFFETACLLVSSKISSAACSGQIWYFCNPFCCPVWRPPCYVVARLR